MPVSPELSAKAKAAGLSPFAYALKHPAVNSQAALRKIATGKPMIDGREVSAQAFERHWNNVFRNDPEMQRLLAEAKGKKGSEKVRERAATTRAIALGWRPPDHDWSVDFDKNGFRTEKANAYTRNSDWIVPLAAGVATLGIPAIAAAAGAAGGAGAAGAGTAASTATPTLAGVTAGSTVGLPGAAATLGAAPAVAGAATPLSAAAAAGNLAGPAAGAAKVGSNVLPAVTNAATGGIPGGFWTKAAISLGVDAFKTYMSNRASGKANEALQKGNQQAIDLYGKALSPYMNLGAQSANALGGLMGFNMGGGGGAPGAGIPPTGQPTTGRTMPPGTTPTGTAVPRPAMVDPQGMGPQLFGRSQQAQQQSRSSFVPMIAPDGEQGQVPFDRVAEAEAAGARRMS